MEYITKKLIKEKWNNLKIIGDAKEMQERSTEQMGQTENKW